MNITFTQSGNFEFNSKKIVEDAMIKHVTSKVPEIASYRLFIKFEYYSGKVNMKFDDFPKDIIEKLSKSFNPNNNQF